MYATYQESIDKGYISKPHMGQRNLNGYRILTAQNTIAKWMKLSLPGNLPAISGTRRCSLAIQNRQKNPQKMRMGKCSCICTWCVWRICRLKDKPVAINLADAFNRVQPKLLIDLLVQHGSSQPDSHWPDGLQERSLKEQCWYSLETGALLLISSQWAHHNGLHKFSGFQGGDAHCTAGIILQQSLRHAFHLTFPG